MRYYEVKNGKYFISTNKALLDIDMLHHYLSKESYWAKHIPLKILKTSIKHAECFGMYYRNKQIGFARVVTDYATFGYLADVFMVENFREKGLSKWLMKVILAHPKLQSLRSWMLGTKDAHGLYRQFGFKPIDNPERFMRKTMIEQYTPK